MRKSAWGAAKKKGVVAIGISEDDGMTEVEAFQKKAAVKMPLALDSAKMTATAYSPSAIIQRR
jgi:hypothetical protein